MRGPYLLLIAGLVFADGILLGRLPLNPETSGSGCAYAAEGEGAKTDGLVAVDNDDDTLRLIVDGVRTSVPFVTRRTVNQIRDVESLGDSLIEYYKGKGIEARLLLATSRLCPDAEDCDELQYKGLLIVTARGTKKTIRVTGECALR